MAVHGPSVGYCNGKKNQYRRDQWAFVEAALGPCGQRHVPRRERVVLLLDEADGQETFRLIANGYEPSNLHVVNFNPAKVAVLQSRVNAATGKRINTYGCDLGRAVDRLPERVDVAHLDFTANFSMDTAMLVSQVSSHLGDGSVCIVNVLKGREQPKDLTNGHRMRSKLTPRRGEGVKVWTSQRDYATVGAISVLDFDRLKRMWLSISAMAVGEVNGEFGHTGCRWHSDVIRWGSYRAGMVPMLWLSVVCRGHDHVDRLTVASMAADVIDKRLVGWYDCDPANAWVFALYQCLNCPSCLHYEAVRRAEYLSQSGRWGREMFPTALTVQ